MARQTEAARSTGHQLAVLLQVQYMPFPDRLEDTYLTYIVQAVMSDTMNCRLATISVSTPEMLSGPEV